MKRFRDGSKGTSAPHLSPTLFVHFREFSNVLVPFLRFLVTINCERPLLEMLKLNDGLKHGPLRQGSFIIDYADTDACAKEMLTAI